MWTIILKSVETSTGKNFLYPFLTYCYVGLETTLQALLRQPNFLGTCGQWKHRREGTLLRDVYDGRVWKEFQNYNDDPFLSISDNSNLALMLNLDFFQPYKHVQYSLGAIYLTIMSLPREVRYKQENVILIGLIPGPSEPKHDLNSFLEPLVDELLKFWVGVELAGTNVKRIRCALLCVACDIPAGRKVCGFLAHNARLGCSRYFKKFPGMVGSMDFSGFERDKWQLRSGITHSQNSLKLLKARTKTELQEKE